MLQGYGQQRLGKLSILIWRWRQHRHWRRRPRRRRRRRWRRRFREVFTNISRSFSKVFHPKWSKKLFRMIDFIATIYSIEKLSKSERGFLGRQKLLVVLACSFVRSVNRSFGCLARSAGGRKAPPDCPPWFGRPQRTRTNFFVLAIFFLVRSTWFGQNLVETSKKTSPKNLPKTLFDLCVFA